MEMIFAPDENGEPVYTMKKLLPRPSEFSSNIGYSKVGYYWCNIIWGTKWDVVEPEHRVDGSTLILRYDTAWGPNIPWVKALCKIISHQLYWEKNDSLDLFIEHNYWELGMEFGGNMIWNPGAEIRYDEYDIVEYAYLYNKCLYNWLIEDLWYKPYNPGWEKFNKQLEKFANPNLK